ncbi:MAG: glucose 1-dehydrogenase, partial [Sphingomonadales bacterium]|nr:glucose 1-dehydrogenase [Sphingomonadales bacterium]
SMAIATPASGMSAFSLGGRIALVTGGGSGLGLAIARCMAASGCRVIVTGRSEGTLIEACAEIGATARYLIADVTDEAALAEVIAEIGAREGRLDILVNNAGNHMKKPFADTSLGEFDRVMDTHVRAAFDLTRQALPLLRKSQAASVIFIASMASYLSVPLIIGYTAAKSAVLGLIRGAAAELGAEGIRVNGIAPGWIGTAMTDQAFAGDPQRKAKILSRTPLGRLGDPDDIGWAATYLASDAARFVTGHTLIVDGGAVSGF